MQLVHPVLQPVRLSTDLEHALCLQVHGGGFELRKIRLQWSRSMVEHASRLRDEEAALKSAMPPRLSKVLRDKRCLLFRWALDDIEYADAKVSSEMMEGFPLSGLLPVSNVFDAKIRVPAIHPGALKQMSASFNASTLAVTKPTLDPDMGVKLWASTAEDVDAGYLEGPYDFDSVAQAGPSCQHPGFAAVRHCAEGQAQAD